MFKKSRREKKSTQHVKNHKNINWKVKIESINTNTEMMQILDFPTKTKKQLLKKWLNEQLQMHLKPELK